MPGRESRLRERPYTRITDLVPPLTTALLPFLDRPFAFYGHSLGALVSFETVRQLRRLGQPLPETLLVSGCRAPQVADSDPPIYHLNDAEFIDGIRKLKGTPEQVLQNRELLSLVMPLLRADFEASSTYDYVAEPVLPLPIVAFSGDADEKALPDAVAQWEAQTDAAFTHHALAGEHFFLHEPAFMVGFSAEIKKITNALR